MFLTQEERDKFALYLDQRATDNELHVAQIEKMIAENLTSELTAALSHVAGLEEMARRLKIEAAASRVVAIMLRLAHFEEIQS